MTAMLPGLAVSLALVAFTPPVAALAPASGSKSQPKAVADKLADKKAPTKRAAKAVTIAPELREVLERIGEPVALTLAERALVDAVVTALEGDDLAAAQAAWGDFVHSYAARVDRADIAAIVQLVIRRAYLETNADLKAYADELAHYNTLKKTVRDHTERTRRKLARKKPDAKVSMRGLKISPNPGGGAVPVELTRVEIHTVAQWQAVLDAWEHEIEGMAEATQLAQLRLQDALQKQQQLFQLLSSIMKSLHDTAKNTIQNMRG